MGGKYLKPTALANVHAFYQRLGSSVSIIGVGGIYTGSDLFEFILVGASAVQLGTVLMQKGLGVFYRIKTELEQIISCKKYTSMDQFKGKLKYL